jgi:hypothetical protein
MGDLVISTWRLASSIPVGVRLLMMKPIAFLTLAVLPATLAAQTVPFLSLEGTAGDGGATTHTATAEYSRPGVMLVRFGGSVRLGGPGAIRPVLSFEHSPTVHVEDGLLSTTCRVLGTCTHEERQLQIPAGNAFGAGLRAAWGSRIVGGIGAGIGAYQHGSVYLSSDVAVRFAPHLSVVADVRRIMWREGDREPIHYTPISIGLRAHQ